MTELAPSVTPPEMRPPGRDYLPQGPEVYADAGPPHRRTGPGIGQVLAGVAGATAGLGAIVWFVFFSPGEAGSKAEWFFGAMVFVALLVSLWQTHSILRQSRRESAEAAQRLREELAAAGERSAREQALIKSIHEAQMDSAQQLARAELAAQMELARVERVHLIAQQQKIALDGVARAVNANTQALATLWNQAAGILRVDDRDAREQAMKPVFEQIAQVVNDFSVEFGNAHVLVDDDRLHRALAGVNDAVLMAMHVAEDVHLAVVEGREPQSDPVVGAQRLMHQKAAEARHLAWNLLRTGLDDAAAAD